LENDALRIVLSNLHYVGIMRPMSIKALSDSDDGEADGKTLKGPYDPDPGQAGADWFLPNPLEESDLDPVAMPLPRVDKRLLIESRDWAKAQADRSAELAHLAALFGALDERLRLAPLGWRHRLALLEAAELSWWAGDRITAARLALWEALRLPGAQEDAQALARAAWALRRLSGGPAPIGSVGETQSLRLADFLDRQGPDGAVPDDVTDLVSVHANLTHLHPVTQAAALFYGWRILGQSGHDPAGRDIEAAVLAGRMASAMGRGAAVFMPQAISGLSRSTVGGSVLDRLAQWLAGAERATLTALLHLDRLAEWSRRAVLATQDLRGRTPALLAAVLAEWPMVTAPMAELITGANRATVQRNLTVMQDRGLIREVTGQGRYRVWTAKV
jgi:hypothetical protein